MHVSSTRRSTLFGIRLVGEVEISIISNSLAMDLVYSLAQIFLLNLVLDGGGWCSTITCLASPASPSGCAILLHHRLLDLALPNPIIVHPSHLIIQVYYSHFYFDSLLQILLPFYLILQVGQ